MSDENTEVIEQEVAVSPEPEIVETTVEPAETVAEVQTQAVDPSLEEAVRKGYNPDKAAFVAAGNDPNDFKTPKQWLNFGELLDSNYQLKKQLTDMHGQIKTVVEISQKAREKERENHLANLNKLHEEAVMEGNAEKALAITKEIVKESVPEFKEEVKEVPIVNAEMSETDAKLVRDFTARNPWFSRDPVDPEKYAMSDEAIRFDSALLSTRPDLSTEERFKKVEAFVRFKYPQKFINANQSKPSAVVSGETSSSIKASGKREVTVNDLPPDLKRIALKFTGNIQKTYIADCVASGYVKL